MVAEGIMILLWSVDYHTDLFLCSPLATYSSNHFNRLFLVDLLEGIVVALKHIKVS